MIEEKKVFCSGKMEIECPRLLAVPAGDDGSHTLVASRLRMHFPGVEVAILNIPIGGVYRKKYIPDFQLLRADVSVIKLKVLYFFSTKFAKICAGVGPAVYDVEIKQKKIGKIKHFFIPIYLSKLHV